MKAWARNDLIHSEANARPVSDLLHSTWDIQIDLGVKQYRDKVNVLKVLLHAAHGRLDLIPHKPSLSDLCFIPPKPSLSDLCFILILCIVAQPPLQETTTPRPRPRPRPRLPT